MNLSHYSNDATVVPYAVDQSPEPYPYAKPCGLWVSVDGPDDWAAWCAEQFRDTAAQHRHIVTLAEGHDVLVIDTARGLVQFSEAYGKTHWLGGDACIDWAAVAKRHQGVIVAPYQRSARYDLMWYYGWDCASGCIWDPAAIASVTLAHSDYARDDDEVEVGA